jgi:uncharacterized protein YidB (DUF937 family)
MAPIPVRVRLNTWGSRPPAPRFPFAMAPSAAKVIQDEGGVSGVVSKLSQNGLGDQARSWVGTGTNQQIAGSQLTQAFGEQRIQQAAAHAGVPPSQAESGLAAAVPMVIDRLTPNGEQPADQGTGTLSEMISQLQAP